MKNAYIWLFPKAISFFSIDDSEKIIKNNLKKMSNAGMGTSHPHRAKTRRFQRSSLFFNLREYGCEGNTDPYSPQISIEFFMKSVIISYRVYLKTKSHKISRLKIKWFLIF